MGVNYLYPAINPGHIIVDVDTFLYEGSRKWSDSRALRWSEEDITDADIVLNPEGPSTIISHFKDNRLISASGLDFEEATDIAAWVRSLNPDPNLVLWFTTSVFDGHTVLTPGITPQQVIDQWVDHREHDPYIEYPQYFHSWTHP